MRDCAHYVTEYRLSVAMYLLFSSLLSMDWWFRLLRVIQTILYLEFPSFYISHNFENNPELCVLVVFMSVYLVAYNQILQMGSYKSYIGCVIQLQFKNRLNLYPCTKSMFQIFLYHSSAVTFWLQWFYSHSLVINPTLVHVLEN